MGISARATRTSDLGLADLLRTAQRTGAIDIALGIPNGQPPAEVLQAAVDALRAGHNQYADPAGLVELRVSIAAELRQAQGVSVDPATEVTVTCGATEGMLVALLAVTDPGDEVVVFEPFYESYPGLIEVVGCVPVYASLQRPGWRIDPETLRRVMTPRTRAVIVNTPHNPTGRVFDTDELGTVLEACREHDVVCLTDEVYADYVFEADSAMTPLALPGSVGHVVSVGSFSKKLHMTGWRVGFCVADAGLTAALRTVHSRTTVGTSHPLQIGVAARQVFGAAPQRDALRRQRDQVMQRLASLGFAVCPAEGGWFLLAGVDGLSREQCLGWSATDLTRRLLEDAGVLVAPGTVFFADPTKGEHWIRVTFARDPYATSAALDRISAFLAERQPSLRGLREES